MAQRADLLLAPVGDEEFETREPELVEFLEMLAASRRERREA
jgi:hypothetical protein